MMELTASKALRGEVTVPGDKSMELMDCIIRDNSVSRHALVQKYGKKW